MTATMNTPAAGAAAATGLIDVDAAALSAMLREGRVTLIDVREPDEHAAERIAGAALMPLSSFAAGRVSERAGAPVVLHCQGGVRSAQAARALLESGWPGVRHLAGGLNAWKKAGLPTTSDAREAGGRRGPIAIMRQVQITAGSLVVMGVVLGAVVSPWWSVLAGGVGAGLVFAGATGTCAMASLLAVMPWNRALAARGGVVGCAVDSAGGGGAAR